MKWLILGGNSRLATALASVLDRHGEAVASLTRHQCNITVRQEVESALAENQPNVIVNCAAYTDVDGAETHVAEAWRANAEGPQILGSACASASARHLMIHLSTDYVFGESPISRRPITELDSPRPLSVYGRSKLSGERALIQTLKGNVLIVRTAWLHDGEGQGFVGEAIRAASNQERMRAAVDQVGQPTWIYDLGRAILRAGMKGVQDPSFRGIFHVVNSGSASRFETARFIYALMGLRDSLVEPVSREDFALWQIRPSYSVLSSKKWSDFGMSPLRDWRAGIQAALRKH